MLIHAPAPRIGAQDRSTHHCTTWPREVHAPRTTSPCTTSPCTISPCTTSPCTTNPCTTLGAEAVTGEDSPALEPRSWGGPALSVVLRWVKEAPVLELQSGRGHPVNGNEKSWTPTKVEAQGEKSLLAPHIQWLQIVNHHKV